ncbi:hypothetical protein Acr_19g0006110 [Actinidia rufa]|uniref:Uncharacterized protein n=1 Tax=Actinidia rufa TaxID=165716 RepID=A0A7J0GA46_9ERIC|nr:hypothetical protein Acr_19g0006110 [Actinidia rufa]
MRFKNDQKHVLLPTAQGHRGLSPPRGAPLHHGRGTPCPSHIRPWMEFEAIGDEIREAKILPNPGEREKRETKSGRWPNPGPSPSAKQAGMVL